MKIYSRVLDNRKYEVHIVNRSWIYGLFLKPATDGGWYVKETMCIPLPWAKGRQT